MPTLTDEIKTFIVKGLACYDTPSQVAEAVKAEFNVEITRQHVYSYDPNASQHMAPRWRELHAATRAALLRELAQPAAAMLALTPIFAEHPEHPEALALLVDAARRAGDGPALHEALVR